MLQSLRSVTLTVSKCVINLCRAENTLLRKHATPRDEAGVNAEYIYLHIWLYTRRTHIYTYTHTHTHTRIG